jgi:hypothetical protein
MELRAGTLGESHGRVLVKRTIMPRDFKLSLEANVGKILVSLIEQIASGLY